jgi:hypothetical protein
VTDGKIATLLGCAAPALTPCYQLNVDGDTGSTFHSKCDNKGPTITIITNNNGYTFGGYTLRRPGLPITIINNGYSSSNSYRYRSDSTAFLFSDVGSKGSLTKYPAVGTNAIFPHPSSGPRFGTSDLQVSADMKSGTTTSSTYYSGSEYTASPTRSPTTMYPTAAPHGSGTNSPTTYPTSVPTGSYAELGGSQNWKIVDIRVLAVSNC